MRKRKIKLNFEALHKGIEKYNCLHIWGYALDADETEADKNKRIDNQFELAKAVYVDIIQSSDNDGTAYFYGCAVRTALKIRPPTRVF